MKSIHFVYCGVGIVTALIGYFFWNLSLYENSSLVLFIIYMMHFINCIGKKIIILEIACLIAILTWLVAPIPFYHYFNESNYLARLWDRYMLLPSDDYYSFALPATLAMVVGMSWKLKYKYVLTQSKRQFQEIKKYLRNKSLIGVLLLGLGLLGSLISSFIPTSLAFVGYLLGSVAYIGLLYIYFSNVPLKGWILVLGGVVLVIQAIIAGMFGEMIYLIMLTIFLLISTSRIPFMSKMLFFFIGLFMVFLIQSVKKDYRSVAWSEGASPLYFGKLIVEKIKNPSDGMTEAASFALLTRINQGWLICKTMYHVPKEIPYANGETVAVSLLSTVVPRFLWPEKPEAGGMYNIERFWGMKLRGYSMNIGPIGESYANFGRVGGVAFMFFYGLFFNVILNRILKLSIRNPTWLLWLPFLFLYAIGTETDMVSTFNYLVKAFMFLFVLRLMFREIFKVHL